jgi:L-ascorbate metabolism protein UlaG (beta-lactamase superfamily)
MARSIRFGSLVVAAAVVAVLALLPFPPATARAAGTVKVEWLGWSHFRLTSPNGKVVLTNPFIDGNADAAVSQEDITQADIILCADGHRDELGAVVPLAQRLGSKVIAPGETNGWLIEQGIPAAQFPGRFSLPGDVFRIDGITVHVVNSVHSSGLPQPTIQNPYGGLAEGFFITFENGWTVYFTGSSAATSDMALWASMYKPDAMIFHMAANHEPLDVATAIKLTTTDNPNLVTLMPHHHRLTIPPGGTTVDAVQTALSSLGVNIPITNQTRSAVYEFTK